ncbi:hypothetical protein [Frigoribacterium sp. NBH87]|uniref:hypothetical protein n=1 Tax=Frigoribacterium sp. NBH87 TaxID=2596916 RepID=UPI00162970EC|nr:hypothetical protein [Frigoribacterium sp. NBH87]
MTWGSNDGGVAVRSDAETSTTRGTGSARRGRALRRARGLSAVAVVGVVAVVATGCTGGAPEVTDPTRVLQSVATTLSSDGSITAVDSTTVSVDDTTGTTSTSSTEHVPADVADDLPIRVSTSYRAGDRSGTDLADLDGFDGRVEIDLAVENLTVAPQELTYDVAGSSRTDPALVGAPLSLAASTVLEGVSPSSVVTDVSGAAGATDGIVSTNDGGDAVVQWGALLAPPRSGASTTLHLVADVADFRSPTFDLAAQAGLSTDLSVDGVLASAFDDSSTSELALQERTIALVSDVDLVLSRAGETITEVRTNLESTSDTLGVRTAEQLRDSSASLASTMQGLSGQLTALESDLGATVTATQSTVLSQLQTTVTSVDTLLGDTTATAPAVTLDGEGCAAVVPAPEQAGSVYGSLLQMATQLDAYAQASALCRDEVSVSLASTVGPAEPTAEICATQQSLTCSLYGSSLLVTLALVGLVGQGDELAESLQPELADAALDRHADVTADLVDLSAQIEALAVDPSDSAVATALTALDATVTSVRTSTRTLRDQVDGLHDRAESARREIGDEQQIGSMRAQAEKVAAELCDVVQDDGGGPGISRDEVERLRSYLVAEGCADDGGTEVEPGQPAPTPAQLDAPFPYRASLAERLDDQLAAWDDVVATTDVDDDTQGLGLVLADLDEQGDDLAAAAADVRRAVAAGDGSVDGAVEQLREAAAVTTADTADLGVRLERVRTQQQGLADQVEEAFADTSEDVAEQVQALVGQQVRVVAEQGAVSQASVVDAFTRSIAGLTSTSDVVVGDARETIEEQRGTIDEQTAALTTAVDAQTASTLERIAQSTASSTRDVDGARTLLTADLAAVMLDLGDRQVNGSGILGAMATSAAKSDTADYQLALASKSASGYANIRAEDVAGIMREQAQFTASVDAAATLPAFHLDVPAGATSTTLWSFRIGADQ